MAKISLKYSIKKITQGVLILALGLMTTFPALAVDALVINQINVTTHDKTAAISWTTNSAATGRVEYGLKSGVYTYTLGTNIKTQDQTITISGLSAETTYYFRVVAQNNYSEAFSFEKSFKTQKSNDKTAPNIANVDVAYITGKTVTFQWRTDEPATSEVEYGLTANYGKTRKDSKLVNIHDLVVTGLNSGYEYHFRVRSQDKNKNISFSGDLTVRTLPTEVTDKNALLIFNVQPLAENNADIGTNSAVISWRTNKLASGKVIYGLKTKPNKTIFASTPRNFTQSITLSGLTPNTTYYFEIEAQDIFNSKVKTSVFSFKTKEALVDNPPVNPGQPRVLGATNSKYTPAVALYKTADSPRVYALLANGKKHLILNPNIFTAYAYRWSDIQTIDTQKLNSYTDVTLVKTPDNSAVFYLYRQQGLKIALPSATIFESYVQNRWQDVTLLAETDLQNFTTARLVKVTNDQRIYLLENNQKRLINSENAFKRLGLKWSEIVTINQAHLDSYPTGAVIE